MEEEVNKALKELNENSVNMAKVKNAKVRAEFRDKVQEKASNNEENLAKIAKQRYGIDVEKPRKKFQKNIDKMDAYNKEYQDALSEVSIGYYSKIEECILEEVNLKSAKTVELSERFKTAAEKRQYIDKAKESADLTDEQREDIEIMEEKIIEKKYLMQEALNSGDFDRISELSAECKSIKTDLYNKIGIDINEIIKLDERIKEKKKIDEIDKQIEEVNKLSKEVEESHSAELECACTINETQIVDQETSKKNKKVKDITVGIARGAAISYVVSQLTGGDNFTTEIVTTLASAVYEFKKDEIHMVARKLNEDFKEKKDQIIDKSKQFIKDTKDFTTKLKTEYNIGKEMLVNRDKHIDELLPKEASIEEKETYLQKGRYTFANAVVCALDYGAKDSKDNNRVEDIKEKGIQQEQQEVFGYCM